MADIVDVENALALFIAGVLYPSGAIAGQASTAGPVCKIYRGWPIPQSLTADLAAGVVNISIFTESGGEKNTTRCFQVWETLTPASPQITLAVSGNVVTIGGSIQAGDFAMIKVGWRSAYSVPVAANSTLASLASALAALIPGASAVGPVVTIATSQTVLVAAGGQGVGWLELQRSQQQMRVTLWCASPTQRDQMGPPLRVAFAGIERLTLADGGSARVYYQRSIISDANENQTCYRRDMFFTAEFPISITQSFPSIGGFVADTTGGISPSDTPSPVQSVV